MNPILLSFLVGTFGGPVGGAAAALVGGTLIRRAPDGVRAGILAGAGGFILGTAFLELLLPGLQKASGWQLVFPLLGFAVGAGVRLTIDQTMSAIRRAGGGGEEERGDQQAQRIATSVAVVNILEGIPVGVGFVVSTQLGIVLAALMILENFTEGVSIATELLRGHSEGGGRLWLLATLPGLTLGLGAAAGALLGAVSPSLLSALFGLGAAIMLYAVTNEIIPDAHALDPGPASTLSLLGGIVAGVIFSELS